MRFCTRLHNDRYSSEYWNHLFDALLSLPATLLRNDDRIAHLLSQIVHTLIAKSGGSSTVQAHDVLQKLLKVRYFEAITIHILFLAARVSQRLPLRTAPRNDRANCTSI